MGYTTKFFGQFNLDKPLTFEHAAILKAINDDDGCAAEASNTPPPDGYFQWVPTKDRKGIKWDGNEKFYDYEDWLQWLIDGLLTPWGYALTGEVEYKGEDRDDYGILRVEKGTVKKIENPTKAWSDVPQKDRKRVIYMLQEQSRDMDMSGEEYCAFQSAIALLENVE